MDSKNLAKLLIADFQYSSRGAQVAAEKMMQAQPKIQDAFDKYLETGKMPEWEIEGYTAQRLLEQHGMKPPAALLTLDWLIREPEKAKNSLKRGHDWVRRKDK